MTEREQTPDHPSLLRIVKGDPTPEEVAALVSVVSAMSTGEQSTGKPPPKPEWSAHHHKLRGTHRHPPEPGVVQPLAKPTPYQGKLACPPTP